MKPRRGRAPPAPPTKVRPCIHLLKNVVPVGYSAVLVFVCVGEHFIDILLLNLVRSKASLQSLYKISSYAHMYVHMCVCEYLYITSIH